MERIRAGLGTFVLSAAGDAGIGMHARGEQRITESGAPTASAQQPEPTKSQEATKQYPPGPAGDLDRLAEQKGWVISQSSASTSQFVADACGMMTANQDTDLGPGGWLARRLGGDNPAVLRAGMPQLCAKWASVTLPALEGTYAYSYPDGTYVVVKTKPKPPNWNSDEQQQIRPGTYRVKGEVSNCYWERATKEGEVIDKRFLTHSEDLTVTIRDTDGKFRAEGCGVWKPIS